MALATFDIVSILRRELAQSGCPASTVGALAQISSGKISAYLNGAVPCPAQHDLRLRKTWASLKKLVDYAQPLPIDFRKVTQLRTAINMVESGELQIVIFEKGPGTADD
jgi:hypothetical protein